MQLRICHETRDAYAQPLRHAQQTLRLTPPADAQQRVLGEGVCQDQSHVLIAACSPIRGVRAGGGEESMDVRIRIEPVAA